jgi:hypothetical protein
MVPKAVGANSIAMGFENESIPMGRNVPVVITDTEAPKHTPKTDSDLNHHAIREEIQSLQTKKEALRRQSNTRKELQKEDPIRSSNYPPVQPSSTKRVEKNLTIDSNEVKPKVTFQAAYIEDPNSTASLHQHVDPTPILPNQSSPRPSVHILPSSR